MPLFSNGVEVHYRLAGGLQPEHQTGLGSSGTQTAARTYLPTAVAKLTNAPEAEWKLIPAARSQNLFGKTFQKSVLSGV